MSKIGVQLPAARLQEGVSFVDTPGLGSLASGGAAETRAYLPKCDLGVVLIDAGSTLTLEDIQTMLTLRAATIPVTVLLSKADLLNDEDRARAIAYVREHILSESQLDIAVHPVSTVSSYRAMLDDWFVHDILPLYGHAKELRADSVNRKVGALRDSLISSLRARLGRKGGGGNTTTISSDQAKQVEARLRVAAGQIEKVSLQFENETQRMPLEIQGPFREAAAALMESWSSGGDLKMPPEGIARGALIRTIQNRVQGWREQMEKLASELERTLILAAHDLEVPDEPSGEEFVMAVRELPVFDPPGLNLSVERPSIASLLGKEFALGHIVRKLESRAGTQFSDALSTYSSLVQKWAEGVLKEIKMRFDSYADNYRARAAGSQKGGAMDDGDQRRIIDELKLLGVDGRMNLRLAEESSKQSVAQSGGTR